MSKRPFLCDPLGSSSSSSTRSYSYSTSYAARHPISDDNDYNPATASSDDNEDPTAAAFAPPPTTAVPFFAPPAAVPIIGGQDISSLRALSTLYYVVRIIETTLGRRFARPYDAYRRDGFEY
ncbi:uncharacterized protein MYCFIDRAFT_197078 [Pseudocercospora fijiensis CIRAD86]|uniref:Uncharacterized protein n=1 Tax=Pseudocercospora fijiensis (strain CIRAD86) TaxID=383855 RepID=M3AB29_PSEFD|nr:uncharacterized protein MYCFIDRAFT_197078 [Pseudocercospora fijiensis CIRAD86]EME81771.1 hypothetical protein MYCFIDRAFT_197078 [Pseudocercospora fijiensis CIRAD86]